MNPLVESPIILEVPEVESPRTGFSGKHSAATILGAVGVDSGPQRVELPPIIDAVDFLAQKIILPCELVEGLLHQGSKLVLGGGSKTFKTWSLLDLAVSVATGKPWLGFQTTRGRVLFLNFEIPPGFFQKRLLAVADERGATLEARQFEILNLRGFATGYEVLLPQIIERVKESGYALIVLDPIYKLYGTADENSAGAVAQLLNAIESLAVTSGAAVVFGAHYSKGNQAGKEAIDRISGSGVFARDPDSILSFTRHQEQEAFTVEATLRNFKPLEPFCVRWDYPLMRRDETLDPTKLKQAAGRPKTHTVQKILACLNSQHLKTTDWLKLAGSETGVPKTQFYTLLEEARKDPNLKKDTAGRWFLDAVT